MSHTKIFLLLLLFLFKGFASLPVAAQEEHIFPMEKSIQPQFIWAQFRENPQEEAVISWVTTLRGKSHKIFYDIVPQNCETQNYRYVSTNIHSGDFTISEEEEPMRSYYHHAHLKNLQPSTRYYVAVETDREILGEYYFETAPADNRSVKLLIGGDSRLGDDRMDKNNPRRQMNSRMRKLLRKNPEIIGLAHTADYTDNGTWSEFYYWLKDHFEKTTTTSGRMLPIFPARGNHDMEKVFEEVFWWPNSGDDYYFTANINEQTVLLILNSEISVFGDQRTWLEEELATLGPKKRWITTMYHRPVFPSVRGFTGEESRKKAWIPLFEKYRIDLAASGHDHALKRTLPILGLSTSPEGIVYIGDGGLGVRPREVDEDRWYLAMANSNHNVHLVEYTKNQIKIQAIGMEGQILDNFFIPSNLRHRRAHYRNVIKEAELTIKKRTQEKNILKRDSLPEFDWWDDENFQEEIWKTNDYEQRSVKYEKNFYGY